MFCICFLRDQNNQKLIVFFAVALQCVCADEQRSKTEVSLSPLYERDNDQNEKPHWRRKQISRKQLHEMTDGNKELRKCFFFIRNLYPN